MKAPLTLPPLFVLRTKDLLPFVALTLILGYAIPESIRPPPIVIFVTALLSISPIAYYIGMAVARYQ
jgi:Ca2+/H+ antiporter